MCYRLARPEKLSVRLEALVAEVKELDLAGFRALHPDPGLLFPTDFGVGVDLSHARIDTPSQGLKLANDKTATAFPTKKAPRRAEAEKPCPVVFFLTKSGKNPFGNMITVGRASNNDVYLPLSSVSKLHAYFTQVGSDWTLSDGNATNGTFVADKRLPTGGAAPLADGVTVGFGPETIATFYLPEGLWKLLRAFPSP